MNANRPTVLIVEARFYEDIADELALGATRVLDEAGLNYERITVPGVFEIPAAMEMARHAATESPLLADYVGFISLGCVIRGQTDHYDHICREVSRALMDFAVTHHAPHGFGVLTCENQDQARERADAGGRDIGGRAAHACLHMMSIKDYKLNE